MQKHNRQGRHVDGIDVDFLRGGRVSDGLEEHLGRGRADRLHCIVSSTGDQTAKHCQHLVGQPGETVDQGRLKGFVQEGHGFGVERNRRLNNGKSWGIFPTKVSSPSEVRVVQCFQEVAGFQDEVNDGRAETLALHLTLHPCGEEGRFHFKEVLQQQGVQLSHLRIGMVIIKLYCLFLPTCLTRSMLATSGML